MYICSEPRSKIPTPCASYSPHSILFQSSHPKSLLSRQHFAPISPSDCNTYGSPASIANKRLTPRLNPLDATLTKNRGSHLSSQRGFFLPVFASFTFALVWISS